MGTVLTRSELDRAFVETIEHVPAEHRSMLLVLRIACPACRCEAFKVQYKPAEGILEFLCAQCRSGFTAVKVGG